MYCMQVFGDDPLAVPALRRLRGKQSPLKKGKGTFSLEVVPNFSRWYTSTIWRQQTVQSWASTNKESRHIACKMDSKWKNGKQVYIAYRPVDTSN
eukprot:6065139-Amphidinium_carterae.1